MELNNIIFLFLIIVLGYFLNKYSIFFFSKNRLNLLIDDQFHKPQAFHKNSIYSIGGLSIFFLLGLVFSFLYFFKNIYYPEYITFCSLFLILGLIDDCRIIFKPKLRLLLMAFFLITLVILNDFYIERTGLEFLNNLLKIDIFSLFFICLCFLFIINGANLVDGFNGLLSIHTLIILTILLGINFFNKNLELVYILFYSIIVILIFLKFNFPKAEIFLGDSGAYLLGSFVAISTINTSILNPNVSPFFFCLLLFYLFFEVFFSFFRKLLFFRKNPLLPDNKHLHMLIYKFFLKDKGSVVSNYLVSIYVNLIYLLLLIPGIFLMGNGLFCKYYFLILLAVYLTLYKMLIKRVR